MKYIIFDSPVNGYFPIIFPEFVDHSFIAQSVHSAYPGVKPISAGFCNKNGNVWGKSVSLKLDSLPEDAYYIKKCLEIEDQTTIKTF